MSKERISFVGAGLTSLQQDLDLGRQTAEARVLCLHGNRIADLQGIQQLRFLTDINLSSNEVQSFQGLQTLSALTSIVHPWGRVSEIQSIKETSKMKERGMTNQHARGPRFWKTYVDGEDAH